MPSLFTREQADAARHADLYAYLMAYHRDLFSRQGREIRPLSNHSISICPGWYGYYDHATKEKGNGVDYLTKYLGYNLQDAILALSGSTAGTGYIQAAARQPHKPEHRKLVIPEAAKDNKRVWAYLTKTRGISADIVRALLHARILYQSEPRGNAVFLNPQRDWGEQRGTGSSSHFHGMLTGSRYDGFWYWIPVSAVKSPCYICEAAIDAVSLYELHRHEGKAGGVYISIGGAGKQGTIDRLLNNGKRKLVIATDADAAGDATRSRNPELPTIRPENGAKDWNDQLRKNK